MPPDHYTGEGLRRPSPDPILLGAPALRTYRALLEAFGPSMVLHDQKSWIHPEHTHSMKILAAPMKAVFFHWYCSLSFVVRFFRYRLNIALIKND